MRGFDSHPGLKWSVPLRGMYRRDTKPLCVGSHTSGRSPEGRNSHRRLIMKFPPKRKSVYVFDNTQDKRIFKKLGKLSKRKLTKSEEKLVAFLYSQLERDWRTPLEKFVDKLVQ